ncbi:hypothetical protein GCM10027347_44860 [Larkinella harenae]
MKLTISPALAELPTISSNDLWDLQGNLKDLSKSNYKRLVQSIETEGFFFPLFVWFEPQTGDPYTLDGNQRLRVLRTEFPGGVDLPYVEVKADDQEHAKKMILLISSNYGEVTKDGFDEFIATMPDTDFIKQATTFDEWMDRPIKDLGDDDGDEGSGDYETKYRIEIELGDEASQQKMYNELIERGISCKLLTL